MESKHTRLPWEIYGKYIVNPEGEAELGTWVVAEPRWPIDAEFIVRACNSHYGLLEALKAIVDDCYLEKKNATMRRNINEYRLAAQKAIARAESTVKAVKREEE